MPKRRLQVSPEGLTGSFETCWRPLKVPVRKLSRRVLGTSKYRAARRAPPDTSSKTRRWRWTMVRKGRYRGAENSLFRLHGVTSAGKTMYMSTCPALSRAARTCVFAFSYFYRLLLSVTRPLAVSLCVRLCLCPCLCLCLRLRPCLCLCLPVWVSVSFG